MKSPFPGMDPYLEQKWCEVHTSLIVYARNQLNAQLPDDLQATIEQSVAVQVNDEYSHSLRPDVHVVEEPGPRPQTFRGDVTVAEPLVLPLVDDCYRDGRHHRTNYRVAPKPPFSKEDADWADALLREQGYRT